MTQESIKVGFEYLPRRRLHNSGQPVPVLYHPQSKKVFPHVCLELPTFQVVPIPSSSVTQNHWKESGPIHFTPALEIFISTDKITSQLHHAEQPQVSHSFLIREILQAHNHLCGPLLNSHWKFLVSHELRSTELDKVLQMLSNVGRVEGKDNLSQSAGHALFNVLQDITGLDHKRVGRKKRGEEWRREERSWVGRDLQRLLNPIIWPLHRQTEVKAYYWRCCPNASWTLEHSRKPVPVFDQINFSLHPAISYDVRAQNFLLPPLITVLQRAVRMPLSLLFSRLDIPSVLSIS